MPIPAVRNARDFRTIFTKMDFVERIRDVRYRGECPRVLTLEETLLVNSFYLRFSQKARTAGITMASPVCAQRAKKYYAEATEEKRCFEWYFPATKRRLHLSLHDAVETEDLWLHLRQLNGLEDLEAARLWAKDMAARSGWEEGLPFEQGERELMNAACVRWSQPARDAGLLSTTELESVNEDGRLVYSLSNGESLELSLDDLSAQADLWPWFMQLSRILPKELTPPAPEQEADPWQDDTWRKLAGEMWRREQEQAAAKAAEEAKKKEAEPAAAEEWAENADAWAADDSWKTSDWKGGKTWGASTWSKKSADAGASWKKDRGAKPERESASSWGRKAWSSWEAAG